MTIFHWKAGTNFNSRTHVECDAMNHTLLSRVLNFNSRTHVECDPAVNDSHETSEISIHALT